MDSCEIGIEEMAKVLEYKDGIIMDESSGGVFYPSIKSRSDLNILFDRCRKWIVIPSMHSNHISGKESESKNTFERAKSESLYIFNIFTIYKDQETFAGIFRQRSVGRNKANERETERWSEINQ